MKDFVFPSGSVRVRPSPCVRTDASGYVRPFVKNHIVFLKKIFIFFIFLKFFYKKIFSGRPNADASERQKGGYRSSLQYINFGNAKEKEISYDKIFTNVNDNLIKCGKNIDWNSIFPSEWSSIDINCGSNSNEYKCYKKNTNTEYNKYLCKNTCGNNYYQIQNTNTYTCKEIPISYYRDENDDSSYPQPKPCYSIVNIAI